MRSLTRLFQRALLLMSLVQIPLASAEIYGSGWYGELQAAYGYEDNISRTYKTDGASDEIATLSLGGGYLNKLGENAELVLSGYVIYADHQEFEALDTFGVSLGAEFTYQPVARFDAPWYNIAVTATNLSYRDSDPREGVFVDADVSINKRLNTSLIGHFGYRYKDLVFINKSSAEEENDAAFDVDSHELYLGLDLVLKSSVYLFAEYAYRHGDIRSTVSGGAQASPGDGYDAITMDTVFDEPCTMPAGCEPGYAYRTRGDTQLAELGVSFPWLSARMDLTARYFDARGENGTDYQDWLIKVGLLWTF